MTTTYIRPDPMRVFLYEKQLIMPNGAKYFPLASGLLISYAKKFFPDWTFEINKPCINPDIVAFSVSLWNENYCRKEAGAVSARYPGARVVFGGPSASVMSGEVIHGEGETEFLKMLSGIDTQVADLDDIPSPYLTGVFNGLDANQAIIETNRGCPFRCSYCFWGKGANRIKFHSLDYVRAEADWIGFHKIPYVFCADGNFGMFPRDVEIAKIYAGVKRKYGYPEKFRVCYGKNAEETVFQTARVLTDAGLEKSVTLSPQSRNPETLRAIGRTNIKDEFFDTMQTRYDEAGIPVYSELILGLPCETYESFKEGIVKTMRAGNQLFIYLCECLPGTRLDDPDYKEQYGIKTQKVKLTPVHCTPVDENEVIVIGTSAMPTPVWKRAAVLSWMVQLFYSFKVVDLGAEDTLEYCLKEIARGGPVVKYFQDKADEIVAGGGRCDLINGIYFEPEEVMYQEHFCQGGDPVEIIKARKNNFKKERVCV